MLKLSNDQIAEIQETARQQLKHQTETMRQQIEAHGGKLMAAAGEPILVSGPASFTLGFIFGRLRFVVDNPGIGLSFDVQELWGVGLGTGLTYVAGAIGRPSKGQQWTAVVKNTPGVVTGCSIEFYENGLPVGGVAGAGLSGGIGMIAGGNGKWE